MRFEGRLTRDGRWWLAEVPLLDAMTQGRTRREAFEVIKDWLETAINREDFLRRYTRAVDWTLNSRGLTPRQ